MNSYNNLSVLGSNSFPVEPPDENSLYSQTAWPSIKKIWILKKLLEIKHEFSKVIEYESVYKIKQINKKQWGN